MDKEVFNENIPDDIKEILNKLNYSGYFTVLVGGCVRDILRGENPSDFDLASDGEPEDIINIFREFPCQLVGASFGVVNLYNGIRNVEISTFRQDGTYFDGRRPETVNFTKDIKKDLARRDFTINAMAWHMEEGLFDEYNGLKDLENKIVRTVGNPVDRLSEDYLRILRGIRFGASFNYRLEREFIEVAKKLSPRIKDISQERITIEIEKILLGDRPSIAFHMLKETNILKQIFPKVNDMIDFNQDSPFHSMDLFEHSLCVLDKVEKDIELRWAALLHDIGKLDTKFIDEKGIGRFYGHDKVSSKLAKDILQEFKLPKKRAKNISYLIERHMANTNPYSKRSIKRLLNRIGENNLKKLFKLQEADCFCASGEGFENIKKGQELLKEILEGKEAFSIKNLAIDGRDLINIGIDEGKEIGVLLNKALYWTVEKNVINDKDILIEKIIQERKKMRKYFGTDGIRGIAGKELSPELAFKTGLATAEILIKKDGNNFVYIGKDTRRSSDMIEGALVAGLTAGGANCILLGVVPTPAVSYLTKKEKAGAGIMISASHNPGEYNGIKIFAQDGFKLPDERELELESHIDKEDHILKTGEDIGVVIRDGDAVKKYEDFLIKLIDTDFSGLSIALDCGHGALFEIAPKVFERLGAEVAVTNIEPDGMNINDNCGSTNTSIIKTLVKKCGADCGFSFDGDGDRVITADEKGNEMNGDHMMAALGKALKDAGKLKNNGMVGTVMTNIGLDKFCEIEDIILHKTPVGDRYVLEDMRESNFVFGGEQSGHIIFLEDNTTGDGLLTALRLAELVKKEGKLSEKNEAMKSYPQILVNAKVALEKRDEYKKSKKIQDQIKTLERSYDGIGRVLIRPSGTEPLVRVMIEGEDIVELKEDAEKLAKMIEEEFGK